MTDHKLIARDIEHEARTGNLGAIQALQTHFEPRRLPQGRLAFVPKGAPRDFRELRPEQQFFFRGILDIKRRAKRARYLALKGDRNYVGPRILAEGDSWFEHPCLTDLIEHLGARYAVLSLAKAGDSWSDILSEEGEVYSDNTPMGLLANIDLEHPDIVLLSAGGNDVLGEIEKYVSVYDASMPDKPIPDYLRPNFNALLDYVERQYTETARSIVSRGAKVIIHSYDYPDPRAREDGGQWIGGPLQHYCKIESRVLWRGIANEMLSRFCDRLEQLAAQDPDNITFVKQLETVGSSNIHSGPEESLWNDELHPSSVGFGLLSQGIANAISRIT
jgi:hypothetical protein